MKFASKSLVKTLVVVLAFASVQACRADVTGKKFRDEKHDRIAAEEETAALKHRNKLMAELLRSFAQTTNYQWTFIGSMVGTPIGSYLEAQSLCNDIGFDLPTVDQLEGEGSGVRGIMSISGNLDLRPADVAFTKGGVSQSQRFVVCVRGIAGATNQ